MMLLFTFMGLPLVAQGELVPLDSADLPADGVIVPGEISSPVSDGPSTVTTSGTPAEKSGDNLSPDSGLPSAGTTSGATDEQSVEGASSFPPRTSTDTTGQGDPSRAFTTGPSSRDNPSFQPDTAEMSNAERERMAGKDQLDHDPNRAMFYSLFLPGLGQAYNKKYFKIPVVYGVLGGVSYWIWFNTQNYREASQNYTDDPSTINERYLRAWRRNLELSYISLAAAHALQVLDAYVDAHLFYWDVSPDLTVRVEPSVSPLITNTGMVAGNYGLRCRLTF